MSNIHELSQQPLPHKNEPLSSSVFNEMYKLAAISSFAADATRRFHPYPADAHPSRLFSVQLNQCSSQDFRFISKINRKQVLLFVDGACSNNGTAEARGGCGVVYTSIQNGPGISLPLEQDGCTHTSNRAELRAVLLALGLRLWNGEGFNTVVLACDSEYVVKGVCEWLPKWEKRDWKTTSDRDVKNRDLWEALRSELRRLESNGLLVRFWRIPRDWNEADQCAKDATQILGDENEVLKYQLIPASKPPAMFSKGGYSDSPRFLHG